MANKRDRKVETTPDVPVVAVEETMVEQTVTEQTDETTETTNGAVVATQGEPLDILSDTCPEELRAWYTDAQRAELRSMFLDGRLVREVRRIEISGEKNQTGLDQQQPYFGYVPVFDVISREDGRTIVDISPALLLSRGKLAYHSDWKAMSQVADTPEKVEQKNADETWGVASYFNHGLDLKIRQDVRAHFIDELVGPIGEIGKGVKNIFLNNVAESKQEAFDMVIGKRIARGLPVPDGLTLEKLNIKWPK